MAGQHLPILFYYKKDLVDKFQDDDLRKNTWIRSTDDANGLRYFAFKYKLRFTGQAPEEYPVLLRLSEQYLIRAEARAHLNNISGSLADLTSIRSRAGIETPGFTSQAELLSAISDERRLELFAEFGHRWLDLKRTKLIDEVMSTTTTIKGGTWAPSAKLFPIPSSEILANPELTQNQGY